MPRKKEDDWPPAQKYKERARFVISLESNLKNRIEPILDAFKDFENGPKVKPNTLSDISQEFLYVFIKSFERVIERCKNMEEDARRRALQDLLNDFVEQVRKLGDVVDRRLEKVEVTAAR